MKATGIQAGLVALMVTGALACDLPVFRYTLEKWPAAPYSIYDPCGMAMASRTVKMSQGALVT